MANFYPRSTIYVFLAEDHNSMPLTKLLVNINFIFSPSELLCNSKNHTSILESILLLNYQPNLSAVTISVSIASATNFCINQSHLQHFVQVHQNIILVYIVKPHSLALEFNIRSLYIKMSPKAWLTGLAWQHNFCNFGRGPRANAKFQVVSLCYCSFYGRLLKITLSIL